MRTSALACALLGLAACTAQAQVVALQGVLGNKALLIVDGGAPRAVAPGDSHQGVKVLSTAGDEAVLEWGGRRHTLRVGEAPASVGSRTPAAGSGQRITLTVGSGGHFTTQGSINGRPAVFLVDTGATAVSLGTGDAERMGIDYKAGQPVQLGTANGTALGWRVRLASVRIGDVEVHDVEAVVGPLGMPYVLLGNSFLGRFQLRRDSTQLVLDRRW